MYNANVYCRQRQTVHDNGQTGTVRDGSPKHTFQNIDRWTPGQTDRPTVNRNVTVTEPVGLYLYWDGFGQAESE